MQYRRRRSVPRARMDSRLARAWGVRVLHGWSEIAREGQIVAGSQFGRPIDTHQRTGEGGERR